MKLNMLIVNSLFFLLAGCSSTRPAPVSTLDVDSTMIADKDGMTLSYIAAGEFTMGSKAEESLAICRDFGLTCSLDWFTNQEPPHTISLDAFWIDQTEVTNAMYAKCVQAGECDLPVSIKSYTHASYYGNSEFDNYPVLFVTWEDAKDYCTWSGRRFPTEAEWEKAARGNDERNYPWGNKPPNNELLNHRHAMQDTTPVGQFPKGVSPYGVLDMAGNVWEWVNDWYGEKYYAVSPASNPLGPNSGTEHVLRGGAFGSGAYNVTSTFRFISKPEETYAWFGFRCAKSL